jgi:hypothetical protein
VGVGLSRVVLEGGVLAISMAVLGNGSGGCSENGQVEW